MCIDLLDREIHRVGGKLGNGLVCSFPPGASIASAHVRQIKVPVMETPTD